MGGGGALVLLMFFLNKAYGDLTKLREDLHALDLKLTAATKDMEAIHSRMKSWAAEDFENLCRASGGTYNETQCVYNDKRQTIYFKPF